MFETAELGLKIDKEEYEQLLPQLRVELINAQYDLRKADFPVLILVSGDNRLAMNSVPNELGEWVDARYVRTEPFGPPTDEERERPRFWRYWRALPPDGLIGLLMGAWARNTCVGRMRRETSGKEFERRMAYESRFERALVADGALLLKFWFHLPKKEHRKRLERAEKSPEKLWYVDERDWEIYDNYDRTIAVAEDYLGTTNVVEAPWHVVESTDHNHASVTFARTILGAVKERLERRPAGRSTAPAASPPLEGQPGVLDTVDLTRRIGKKDYRKQLRESSARLYRLWKLACEERVTIVLAFEGWDAAGKGGVIRRLTRAMDARNYRVIPIGAPTDEELAHHYLWRFWRHLPRAGSTLIFDRSWYGRVLVERVEELATEAEWSRAYTEINDFESQFVEHGYVFQKFWLHIDPDEQLRRFEAREQTAYKKHKITADDYRNRDRWSEYERAANDMIEYTSTELAPWHLVPANSKRWARIRVMDTLCDALDERLA